ncbi:WXG100 family type VII secretion target [Nocardia sp. NPDC058658]|uniref:WXG100 family type VII secretion target n=1 Tax=Nocardia sp. NPDC058658 TaxID=3346580 RepID=UPI00365AA204
MSGLEFEISAIAQRCATDNMSNVSHIVLKNTFDPLVTDPATEAKADYAKIAAGWQRDVETFAARINRSSASAWSGTAATAARQAISDYATDAQNLTPALNALSTRVGEAVDAVQKTKTEMPKYTEDPQSWFDWLDGDPDKDAEAAAQKVAQNQYVTPITNTAAAIPVLPQPKDPVSSKDLPQGDGGNGGSNGGGGGTGNPATTPQSTTDNPTTEDPTTEDPQLSTDEDDTTEDEDSSTPESTTPQSTTPESTTPQSAGPSSGQPGSGSPTGGSPAGSGGSPGGSGVGAGVGVGAGGSPGKAVPGTPAGVRAGTGVAASAGSTAAGRNGMPGMGGMGAGGGRGGNGSEDDEHTTPDYLVYDRESELLGTQPPALPPGGVIGA